MNSLCLFASICPNTVYALGKALLMYRFLPFADAGVQPGFHASTQSHHTNVHISELGIVLAWVTDVSIFHSCYFCNAPNCALNPFLPSQRCLFDAILLSAPALAGAQPLKCTFCECCFSLVRPHPFSHGFSVWSKFSITLLPVQITLPLFSPLP